MKDAAFLYILAETLESEGLFVDDKADSGGATKYGITEGVARANGYSGDMRDLPLAMAKEIYHKEYWIKPNFHRIADLNEEVAKELFDTGVNVGVVLAAKWLQRSLTVLNKEGKLYDDLVPDGQIGFKTLEALSAYLHHRRTPDVLIKAMNVLQGYHYISLAERREKDERFVYGWLDKRVR